MKKFIAIISSLALLGSGSAAFAFETHVGKLAMEVQADAHRPCAFFRLDGVTQADPVVPGEPWFSIPKSHASYNELFALVTTAKAGRLPLIVQTTGGTACGYASVNILVIQ